MSVPAWEEHGPEAAATVARWTDERRVLGSEGGTVTEGRDGDTHCLLIDSGTAVDVLAEGDVDERDRRRASRLLRFASAEDRETYIGVRWGELNAPNHDPPPSQTSPTTVDLRLYAGQTNTEIEFSLRREDGAARIACRAQSTDFPHVKLEAAARPDEVERFFAELRLLGAPSWRQFGARAVDGLLWQLTAAGAISIDAGGASAYPPHGEGARRTPTFDRLLLAVERLLGRQLWPSAQVAGLEAIPDHHDRIEHLILAACRSWSALVEEESADPGMLREPEFQRTLFPHLLESTACEREAQPGLAEWDPGNVDFVLEPDDEPTWVELKWCKHRGTFGNCLWDAAKVAAGVRQGRARYGYLLVGAPVAVWEGRLPPEASVTGVSAHRGASLVNDYPSWWGWWCEENRRTYPRKLPAPVMTTPVGRVRHFGHPDSPWELRLIRAESPGDETYAAPCPERPRKRR